MGRIIGALQEKEPLPSHINLATDFVRNLGNITSHPDPVNLDQIDDYLIASAFNSLIPLLRWYLEQIDVKSPNPIPEIDFEECPYLLWNAFYTISSLELKIICKKITGLSFRSKDECLNKIYEQLDTVNEFFKFISFASLKIIADEINIKKKKSITEQIEIILKWCKTARVNRKAVSMIYAPTVNNKTFLHFSWYEEVCKLRDYNSSNNRPTVSQHTTSDITKQIKREVFVTDKVKVENINFWSKKTRELNLKYKIRNV